MSKPHWPDVCEHTRPRDKFLGTITDSDGRPYDIYVYQDNALSARKPDMHLCFRYGNEGSRYISPGPAQLFVDRMAECKDLEKSYPKSYILALPLVKKWLEENKDG